MGFTMRSEFDVDLRIAELLRNFVGKKFNDILIRDVVGGYNRGLEGRAADIAVIKDDGDPLLLIETKKKYEGRGRRIEWRFLVTSGEVLGQVFSYTAILKRNGVYVPFVATANERQIALFSVPEDIVRHVNWDAIESRDYGHVLSKDYIRDLMTTYRIDVEQIRFTEEFFADILDTITGLYKGKYGIKDKRQPLEWALIEDLRGFVDFLTPFIQDAIAPDGKFRDDIAGSLKDFSSRGLPTPSPEQLAREMAYVLLNKIVFYKVLERHYNLEPLQPLYEGSKVRTVSQYLNALKDLFSKAVESTNDFERIFSTGVYDEIDMVESEEVMKALDGLVNLIDLYQIERFGEIVGYVYENLIPAEERHRLGQYYTPRPVAELIVRWSVRTPDDRVLDPGCGSGTFLVEAYKRLAELKLKRGFEEVRYVSEDIHRQILGQLVGIDINEFPAHLTAMNLAMRNPKAPSTATNVIVEDFFNVLPGQKRLVPYTRKGVGEDEGAGLVLNDFDVVVGNPPYTRWTEIPESTQKMILQVYEEVLSKYGLMPQVSRGVEPGIYTYWIIHSTRFLKDGGRLAMIISDSWLQTDYGIGFGRFLADNYRVVAVIDVTTRVFPVPLVGASIVLLEKEPDERKRMENNIVFMMLKPKTRVDVDAVLKLVDEYSRKPSSSSLVTDELVIRVVSQREAYESDRKWVNYMFGAKEFLQKLEQSTLTAKLSKYFEVSYGNILYLYLTSIGKIRGVRNVGGEEFFYLSEERAREVGIPAEFMRPVLSSPKYLKFFTFTNNDWDEIRRAGAECYVFLCHMPRNQLPESVRRYIQMGEGPSAAIRLRRRPGEQEGRPASESEASQTRRKYKDLFFDWYDLGGVIPVKAFALRYAPYWHRFVYLTNFPTDVALDSDMMALIPSKGVELDDQEYKALLAYLNSSIAKLYFEVHGRSTGGGALALEANTLNETPVIDVKKLPRDDVAKLAQLFDKLESEARRLSGANSVKNVFGSELAKELTGRDVRPGVEGLFNTVIKEIDYAIGDILGLSKDEVETIRELVIEYAKRRLARAREPQPGTLRGSEEVAAIEAPKRAKTRKKKGEKTRPALQRKLDEFFSQQ